MRESNCCGANVEPDSDICSECHEHCSIIETCEECDGEGWVDVIDYLKVHSATIDVPYKRIKCEKCDGEGWIEVDE